MRVWAVWAIGVLAYLIAVLHRTTFGVAGLAAAERFAAGPSLLSVFVVLQIVVYAGMQIPAGVLLDRVGSRAMIVAGGAIMVTGQMVLALTDVLAVAIAARALLGVGDAMTFISVLRLVPQWFPERRVPLVSQLTGILGQGGQVLSAVPFLAILRADGWSAAFGAAAAVGVMALLLALTVIRDSPRGDHVRAEAVSLRATLSAVAQVWRRPGTRLGFFSHMGTQFSITTFVLIWGVPYLVSAQGLSPGAAGALLTVSVVTSVVAGVLIGILSGRYPTRRSWMVLSIMGSSALMWVLVLARATPSPLWLLTLLVVVISVGGPGSLVGFDYARLANPSSAWGTAQGMVNMGGFLAALVVMQVMGLVLGALGGYTFDNFRLAWLAQFVVWVLAAAAVLHYRTLARREAGVVPRTLAEVRERIRRAR